MVIVSGDKDFYQLIGPKVSLLNPGRGGPAAVEEQLVTAANAARAAGRPPEQTVDFLALVGDSADNVPGVRGVGEKTAQKLLRQYGTLDAILAHAGEIEAKRVREALARGRRPRPALARAGHAAPGRAGGAGPRGARRAATGLAARCSPLLSELEFHSLVRSLGGRAAQTAPAPAEASGPRTVSRTRRTPSPRWCVAPAPRAPWRSTPRPRRSTRCAPTWSGCRIAVAPGRGLVPAVRPSPLGRHAGARATCGTSRRSPTRRSRRWRRCSRDAAVAQDRPQHQVRLAGAAPRRGRAGGRRVRHDDRELHDRPGQALARARRPRAGALQRPAARLYQDVVGQGARRAELRRGAGAARPPTTAARDSDYALRLAAAARAHARRPPPRAAVPRRRDAADRRARRHGVGGHRDRRARTSRG